MPSRSRPVMPHQAFVALGSNLETAHGSPAQTVEAGLAALLALLGERGAVLAASSFYETEPVGLREQPRFVNAAVCLRSGLSPEALMAALLDVEQAFGRVRGVPDGPRTLDLDLLMVDDLVLSSQALTLPHPRMAGRRFVLAPLAEIAPGVRHPVLGMTFAELLARLPDVGEQSISAVRVLPGVRL